MWLWHWKAVVVRITPYPYPSHPIHPNWMWLSIHAAFTEEGGWRWEEGKRDWGLRGREVVFLSLLAQREGKNNWCANGCLSLVPGWPAPPFLHPISPSIPSAVSGCLKGGTLLWRGDLCKNWINNVADSLCCMCVLKIPLLCFVCACVFLCVQTSLSKKKRPPVSSVIFIGHNWQWPLW